MNYRRFSVSRQTNVGLVQDAVADCDAFQIAVLKFGVEYKNHKKIKECQR